MDEIRDPDLVAQLEEARGGPGFAIVQRHLAEKQRERDEVQSRRALMSPHRHRRDVIREVIANKDISENDIGYIHSVLALCGFPYRRPKDTVREWQREYGRNSLYVAAGALKNPETGLMESQGLPYGPKARLLMIHICSEAILQRSKTIELDSSFTAFVRAMGFEPSGGKRGNITQFKEQLNRIAACNISIGFWDGDGGAETVKATPIKKFSIWLPQDADQRLLWSSTLTFDQEFHDSLMKHALPVDLRGVAAFRGSARKLDIVLWLGFRLRYLTRQTVLTWSVIEEQFGAGIQNKRVFRKQFEQEISDIKEIYTRLPIKITTRGLHMSPADTDKLFVPPKRLLKQA